MYETWFSGTHTALISRARACIRGGETTTIYYQAHIPSHIAYLLVHFERCCRVPSTENQSKKYVSILYVLFSRSVNTMEPLTVHFLYTYRLVKQYDVVDCPLRSSFLFVVRIVIYFSVINTNLWFDGRHAQYEWDILTQTLDRKYGVAFIHQTILSPPLYWFVCVWAWAMGSDILIRGFEFFVCKVRTLISSSSNAILMLVKWLQRFYAVRIFIWIRLKIVRMTFELSLLRSSQIMRSNYKAKHTKTMHISILRCASDEIHFCATEKDSWPVVKSGWNVCPVVSVNFSFILFCQTNWYATCFRHNRNKLAKQETTWSCVHDRVE